MKAIADSMYDEYKEPLYAPPPLLLRMVEAGRLGKKSGKGFYRTELRWSRSLCRGPRRRRNRTVHRAPMLWRLAANKDGESRTVRRGVRAYMRYLTVCDFSGRHPTGQFTLAKYRAPT